MKIVNDERYYTLGEVSSIIGKTRVTILRWYEYEAQTNQKFLPEPTYFKNPKIRYYSEDDLEKFAEFKNHTPRGAMVEVSNKYNGNDK